MGRVVMATGLSDVPHAAGIKRDERQAPYQFHLEVVVRHPAVDANEHRVFLQCAKAESDRIPLCVRLSVFREGVDDDATIVTKVV